MSIFTAMKLGCPSCGKDVDFKAVQSVNIDRKAELREEILAGTFQQEDCPECGKAFRLDPAFTYTDLGRKQWIAAFAIDDLSRWEEIEAEVLQTFDLAYGAQATKAARDLARGVEPRLVFGWAALCEKLIAAKHGIDDVRLEYLKVGLLRSLPKTKFDLRMETELRFVGVSEGDNGPELALAWLRGRRSEFIEGLNVPRALYDEISEGDRPWKALQPQLTAGPFVDMERLITVGTTTTGGI